MKKNTQKTPLLEMELVTRTFLTKGDFYIKIYALISF